MNFACESVKGFSTTKNLAKRRKISESAQKRKDFIENHNFSVSVSSSGQCNLTVTEKEK